MKHFGTVGIVLCCMGPIVGTAWGADAVVAAAKVARTETMVVRIKLNTEDKGDVFIERTGDGDFLVKVQDLEAMGFRNPRGTVVIVEKEPHISLRSMAGVSFQFRQKELTLDITAAPGLLPTQSVGFENERRHTRGVLPEEGSLFVNYALSAAGGGSGSTGPGFSGEAGWRYGEYLFLSNGSTVQSADMTRKFVRLMSSVTHDDREELQRTVVGDFFTPSRDFSNGINLGGVSISKLYGLNPYLIQFPMQSVSGNVALPTDLEIYIDGQRVRTEALKPGQFELRDILAYGGAHNVQLVLRDAFGRVQQLDYSFYFSDQPLRQGLHEYSYNLGAIRRDYGQQSNHYGPPAFTMFHRYGVTDAVTLGLRAEGTKELLSAGPLATVVLGSAGVASVAIAGSSVAGHHGAATLAAYNYQARAWTAGLSLRRDWREYATLGDPPVITNRKLEGNVSASYLMGNRGTLSLSHSFFATRDGMVASAPALGQPFSVSLLENRRQTTLSYSVPLISGWAALTASASHIKDKSTGSRNELFVGINVFLDKDYSAAASYRGDKNGHSESVQLTKLQPIGEGLGFTVAADRTAGPTNDSLKSSVQYNAPSAIFRADLGRTRDQQGKAVDDYRVSAAGGVGYVDGAFAFGRPITGSFGIVKVGELPGVGVLVNGQPIGQTNPEGKVFVPTLTPFYDNEITIAPETVPIDYSLPSASKTVSPSYRSGVVVNFAVTKLQAFSGKLKVMRPTGIQPVEFHEISAKVGEKMEEFQTGHGGEFYIENLKPGSYAATVQLEGMPCAFDLVIPRSGETFVNLGEVVCSPRP